MKTPAAAVAPDTEPIRAPGDEVQPAIVVVVEGAHLLDPVLLGGEAHGFTESAEIQGHRGFGHQRHVGPEVVVEITDGQASGHRPIRGLGPGRQAVPTLVGQNPGPFSSACEQHIREVIVVPIFDGHRSHSGHIKAIARAWLAFAEDGCAVIGEGPQTAFRGDCQQRQFACDVDVSQGGIRSLQGPDPAQSRSIGDEPIGGELEQLGPFGSHEDCVVVAVVIQVSDDDLLNRSNRRGQRLGPGREGGVGVPEQSQAPLIIGQQNIVPTSTVQVKQAERAFESPRLRAQSTGGVFHKSDGDRVGFGLLEGERGQDLGVLAFLEECRVVSSLRLSGRDPLVLSQLRRRLFSGALPQVGLAELVVGRGVILVEFDHLNELLGSIGESSPPRIGKPQLETNGIESAVGLLGLGQRLDRVGKGTQAEMGAARQVMGRAAPWLDLQGLAGMDQSLGRLARQEEGVGQIQVNVRIGRVHRQGHLEGLDGPSRIARGVVATAGVHVSGELGVVVGGAVEPPGRRGDPDDEQENAHHQRGCGRGFLRKAHAGVGTLLRIGKKQHPDSGNCRPGCHFTGAALGAAMGAISRFRGGARWIRSRFVPRRRRRRVRPVGRR